MIRHRIFLVAASVLAVAYDQRSDARDRAGDGSDDSRSVILVVSDGLRWQEVFRGADSTLLFGNPKALGDDGDGVRRKYWRATVAERRQVLMPFVWSTLARQGQLSGNRDLGSRVEVTNGMKFSYPGYNEMLVGYPDPRIDRNEYGPNPNVTVFEWLNQRREFRGRVAAFGTWDTFHDIFNVQRSRIQVHTNGSKPHDGIVQREVLPYLKDELPRALFVGYAETDDFGHEGRYDRFLDAAHAVDAYIAQLWSAVQSDPHYRGKTTLIFTADHGRGRTSSDWTDHGKDVAGAEETFIVMIGPQAEALGELRNTASVLGRVAGTTAAALGQHYRPR
ncbi:MAG TPA: alkaline phosphatase family protein [Gemmatimonadaceae bacterium]